MAPPTLCRQITVIVAYMLTSIAIVYFNRWLFIDVYPYPVFVSWVQQIIGLGLYYVLAFVGRLTEIPLLARFHLMKVDFWVLYQCAPQIITFTLMVGLANLCLEYVQVSTYQVARSLSLIFSIILTKVMLGTLPVKLALIGATMICSGFLLNSLDPQTLSFTGLTLGACSSFFQAYNGVLVSKNMTLFENDGQKLLLYNMAGASMTMLPMVFIFGEADAFTYLPLNPTSEHFAIRWFALIGSGVFCILINLTTFLCINATSPVSMTVIGFSKSIVQSVGGILFWGDVVTVKSLIALGSSLCGTGIYSFAQVQKQKATDTVAHQQDERNIEDVERQNENPVASQEETTTTTQMRNGSPRSVQTNLDKQPSGFKEAGGDSLELSVNRPEIIA